MTDLSATHCPEPDQLRALLDGSLPPELQTAVQTHVDGCVACQQTLDGLTVGGESWIGVADELKQPTSDANSDDKLAETMSRMKASESAAEGFAARNDERIKRSAEDIAREFLSPSNQPGSLGKLGGYEVSEIVGYGGFGVVFKAFDAGLHRVVAVKVLASHLAHHSVARKRFIREAQAAAAVCHENVITIHGIDESGTQPKIVMQFVQGGSLQERIEHEGPLELKEILRIGLQTAAGLAAAHAQGLVHRDVKPGNILLENGVQRVKLTDFGLARVVDDASLTMSGVIAGTPQYMAPEQAWGRVVDHRADLFSLGASLYAMCVGHSPFRARSTMAVLKRVCEEEPRPIQALNPEIPEWLAAIIMKLLAKNPDERFQSATEVSELLGNYLAFVQQPTHAPEPTGWRTRVTAASGARLSAAPQATAPAAAPSRTLGEVARVPFKGIFFPLAIVAPLLFFVPFVQPFSRPNEPFAYLAFSGMMLALAGLAWFAFYAAWNTTSDKVRYGCLVLLGVASIFLGSTVSDQKPVIIELVLNTQLGLIGIYLLSLLVLRPYLAGAMHNWLNLPPASPTVPRPARHSGAPTSLSASGVLFPLGVTTMMLVGAWIEQPIRGGQEFIGFSLFSMTALVAAALAWFAFLVGWNTDRPAVRLGCVGLLVMAVFPYAVAWHDHYPVIAYWMAGMQLVLIGGYVLSLLALRPYLASVAANRTDARSASSDHPPLGQAQGRVAKRGLTFWRGLALCLLLPMVVVPVLIAATMLFSYQQLQVASRQATIAEARNEEAATVLEPALAPEPVGGVMVPGNSGFDPSPPEQPAPGSAAMSAPLKSLQGRWVVVSFNGHQLPSRAPDLSAGGGMAGSMGGGFHMRGAGFVPPENSTATATFAWQPQWLDFSGNRLKVVSDREDAYDISVPDERTLRLAGASDIVNPLFVMRHGNFAIDGERLVIVWGYGNDPLPTEFQVGNQSPRQLLVCRKEWKFEGDITEDSRLPRAEIPFIPDEAQALQRAWAKKLKVEPELSNSIGMKLRLVPPGGFGESVVVKGPIYVGAHEVTVGQFAEFVAASEYVTRPERQNQNQPTTRATWREPGIDQDSDEHPVTCVSWPDALAFCHWLGKIEGRRYRLLTRQEWEFACRAGSRSDASMSGGKLSHRCQFFTTTAPVGHYAANAFGLHDFIGNVRELTWCPADDPKSVHGTSAGIPDRTPKGRCGGAFDQPIEDCQANSFSLVPDYDGFGVSNAGFRVAVDLTPRSLLASEAVLFVDRQMKLEVGWVHPQRKAAALAEETAVNAGDKPPAIRSKEDIGRPCVLLRDRILPEFLPYAVEWLDLEIDRADVAIVEGTVVTGPWKRIDLAAAKRILDECEFEPSTLAPGAANPVFTMPLPKLTSGSWEQLQTRRADAFGDIPIPSVGPSIPPISEPDSHGQLVRFIDFDVLPNKMYRHRYRLKYAVPHPSPFDAAPIFWTEWRNAQWVETPNSPQKPKSGDSA